MKILHHPKSSVVLSLADGARVYRLRVPLVADRPAFRHALLEAGGRQWSIANLLGRLADAAARLMPEGDERAAALADLEAMRDALAAAGELVRGGASVMADEVQEAWRKGTAVTPAVAALERLAQAQDPGYAAALADNAVYAELRGIVAARMFVVGWEGLDEEPGFGAGGLAEPSLALIPLGDLLAIGQRVEELLSPPEGMRKNSASPSGGSSVPATSPDASTQPPSVP